MRPRTSVYQRELMLTRLAPRLAPGLESWSRAMEFMAGVYDLYAFAAITRRWLFWMMAVAIPLGLVTGTIEVVRYLAS